ncbi:MAG TPA: FtsW/RodA/SpoVE family cell cycle protein [Candidatus Blautia gallistercoris]|uniref:FtsW/RodA/SpoVE family cell cycle protein n=1 Tax=Candidatus Blautia gallistercoris TaxID=2838490 RepID=A0A9D2B3C5_9FIRM|nr:FtsW/RodA/SpoVE family cell cycle protein [Candidatus Blautia gallistercoris]
MVNVITELSKYFITLIMILYTLECFTVFRQKGEKAKRRVLRKQLVLIFFMDLAAFTVIFLKTEDLQIVRFYLMAMGYFLAIQILYRVFYKKASILLINNMCMLLSIGFIMLSRLDMDKAQRQFLIVAIGSAIALVVPVMIRKMRFLSKLTWVYAGVGIVLLVLVLALAQVTGGARLSIFGVQPSEFVKIIFVFCMAAMLWKDSSFPQVVRATVVAAVHVLILVLSRDLGSALIFFVTWLVMVYVSTKKPAYFALGLGGGALASVAAYFLFGHVRQRVAAWRDPFAEYQNEGYQIAQSMFAIGTGGWFGMGLCQGSPELIPVVAEDFIFGAICEELGGIFGICLVLVCMSFFLMIVNISLQIKNPFYKLIALGLGTEYAFQVFLTIGGATKFIPMTGVTLPLVSYGGSSVMSTIILLAIIQGLYILREDEGEELEKIRQTAAQTAKTTGEARE